MRSVFQEELFGPDQYTRLCSFCRGEFPRSAEFFPEGHCNDGMASFCRKCAHLKVQLKSSAKNMGSVIEMSQKSLQIIYEKMIEKADCLFFSKR